MSSHKEFIAREGLVFIIPLVLLAFITIMLGLTGGSIIALAAFSFTAWFFRNPERNIPEGKGQAVSPADGKVINIENVFEDDLLHGNFTKISIFMNVFNVHVNRMPCAGVVRLIRYKKGKFISANLDKASSLNEQNAVVTDTEEGKPVITVQIAGLIARRIVCWINEGARVERGERFGLIRFGSRLDVYLPPDFIIMVKMGDKVRAGETVLGVFK